MAKRCEICGKGVVVGRNISHAHNVTPRRFEPNLQRVRVLLDGTLELRLRGGPTVLFGTPDEARRKAGTIERMLAWARAKGTVIRTLIVVSPSAPAATLAD